jgi:hypothetical protein
MTAHELAKKLLEMQDVEVVLDIDYKSYTATGVYEYTNVYDDTEIRIYSDEQH